MTFDIEWIQIRDVRLRMRRAGRGSPLLFLHGAAGVTRWLPFFDKLAERHRLLVPDHPGFGESDDPPWLSSVPDLGMFYLELLDRLDLPAVDVVGHSLGGWIAAEAAVRNGSRIRSLSLIAPAGVRAKGHVPGDVFIWTPQEQIRQLYHGQRFVEEALAAQPSVADLETALKNRYTFARLAWQPRLFNPELQKWLHRIERPVQLIWGRDDKVIPPAWSAPWTEAIPSARSTSIPDCGHLPHVEHDASVAALIESHINGVQ